MVWLALCHNLDIPERDARGFDLVTPNGATVALIAVKKSKSIYVYRNLCPHMGVRLEWQEHQFLDYDKQFIHCSSHGALFEMTTGKCIAGPCAGDTLKSIPCKLENEQLWVEIN